jgi:outer membrane murein-binding lipoprotein Lpp
MLHAWGGPPETRQRTADCMSTDFMNAEVNEAVSHDVGDLPNEISRLEARIEELADALSRCRKFKLASQAAVAGGGLWLAAAITGFIDFDPVAMMIAIAAVIGGTVMYGSNTATVQEVEAEMREAEGKRAALIGALDLRVVRGDGGVSRLH